MTDRELSTGARPVHAGPTRPTWAEISRSALAHNFEKLRAQSDALNAGLICVVKANAYGHGLEGCAHALSECGAEWFAVTSVDEGVALVKYARAAGLQPGRVLVLSGLYGLEDAQRAVRYGLTPVVMTLEQMLWLEEAVRQERGWEERYPFHVEIDTGMARNGVPWDDRRQLFSMVERLRHQQAIALEALMTHFASPDDPASPQTDRQITCFTQAVSHVSNLGIRVGMLHAGNSASLFDSSQVASLSALARDNSSQLLLRPGLALYGYQGGEDLEPVLAWKTRVASLREVHAGEPVSYGASYHATRSSLIATVAAGYADGYNRLLSNKGSVLIRGQRAAVTGRVTMDQTMVDVTHIEGVAVGDEVVLLGTQENLTISAELLATMTGTISWEVLCAIQQRVTRVMVD